MKVNVDHTVSPINCRECGGPPQTYLMIDSISPSLISISRPMPQLYSVSLSRHTHIPTHTSFSLVRSSSHKCDDSRTAFEERQRDLFLFWAQVFVQRIFLSTLGNEPVYVGDLNEPDNFKPTGRPRLFFHTLRERVCLLREDQSETGKRFPSSKYSRSVCRGYEIQILWIMLYCQFCYRAQSIL